jgi:polyhydroxybutyrate depolymerase
VSASSSTDPHHVVSDPSTGRPDIGPPDSTPLAAAAGNEPGEMLPVDGLPPGWVSSVHRFEVDRMTRAYLMVRPDAVTATKLPVVLVLHGRNETPRTIEEISQAPQVTGPAILVFPAGYGRSWDAGGCCGLAHTSHVDDVAFLTDTIHRVIAAEKDAAANRVYLLGFSNGGRMAYRMACADPGLLAGVGAVEAVPVDTCQTVTPLPIMVVAYSNDPLLTIFNGERRKTMQGYLEPTVESTVEAWRNLDGCTTAGDRAVTGSATVDTWTRCVGAGRVAFALYRGGSHRWPQATAATAATPGTPSAGNLIWAWLQRNIVVTDPVT